MLPRFSEVRASLAGFSLSLSHSVYKDDENYINARVRTMRHGGNPREGMRDARNESAIFYVY